MRSLRTIELGRMPQSLIKVPVHIVFSTRNRFPYLGIVDQRMEVHRYLAGICRNLGCPPIKINGTADHVHILCLLSRLISVADLVRDLKSCSSKWIRSTFPEQSQFHWQNGYGAFATSPSAITMVVRYIENQEEHHRSLSFKDEYRNLCSKAALELDERFVWE